MNANSTLKRALIQVDKVVWQNRRKIPFNGIKCTRRITVLPAICQLSKVNHDRRDPLYFILMLSAWSNHLQKLPAVISIDIFFVMNIKCNKSATLAHSNEMKRQLKNILDTFVIMFVNNNLLLTQHGAIRTECECCDFDSVYSQRDLGIKNDYFQQLRMH